jgi:hypothetical protein
LEFKQYIRVYKSKQQPLFWTCNLYFGHDLYFGHHESSNLYFLDMCWTIRLKIVPNCTDELQKIQDVVNTANVYLNELFAMKQWLLRSSKRMASIKAHGCAHIPWQMGIMGPHPFNDTDQCESSHVMDKTEYKRTSKRDESTNEEMLGLVSIYVYVRVYKSI